MLDGWRVCLNFAMDFADDFVLNEPLTSGCFIEGGFAANIFRFQSHSWIFFSPSSVCLNYPCYLCFTKIDVLELSRDDFTKFVVLEFFWNRQNPLFLWNWLCSNLLCLLFLFFFVIFVLSSSMCFNYLEMISPSSLCLNSSVIVRILFSCELARFGFAVLVIFIFRLGSKLPCLFLFLFYFLVPFRFLRTCAVSFMV